MLLETIALFQFIYHLHIKASWSNTMIWIQIDLKKCKVQTSSGGYNIKKEKGKKWKKLTLTGLWCLQNIPSTAALSVNISDFAALTSEPSAVATDLYN